MRKQATDLTADIFGEQRNQDKGKHIYTVSEITQDIKLILENTFSSVWVEGEISNFRPSAAGHYYFSLKDNNAILSTVAFNRAAKDIKFKIEDGLKVICCGRVEVYAPHGKYQLIIERIEPKGIGGLQLALEQLKRKLEKEGLFATERKRQIPYLPDNIGIVTSLQGAAIKDILKVLDRRFKNMHIVINPVRVQGEGAREEIAQAIKDFNIFNQDCSVDKRLEVLIVGRGGGSIEDLWAFNEEVVARAIYNSRIPVISAVGHERDVTISDLVADLRAATPSVAAELVIPEKEDLNQQLVDLNQRLSRALSDNIDILQGQNSDLAHRLKLNTEHIWQLNTNFLDAARKKLGLLNPAALITQYNHKIIDFSRQISVRLVHYLKIKEAYFHKLVSGLSNLSPLNILSRGYSITFVLPGGQVVRDVKSVREGDTVQTKLHKGGFISKVLEVNKNG